MTIVKRPGSQKSLLSKEAKVPRLQKSPEANVLRRQKSGMQKFKGGKSPHKLIVTRSQMYLGGKCPCDAKVPGRRKSSGSRIPDHSARASWILRSWLVKKFTAQGLRKIILRLKGANICNIITVQQSKI